MKYLLVALLAAVVCWFVFFRGGGQVESAPAVAAQVPPEQKFKALLSTGEVDAGELAALCSAYPVLGSRLLNGRQFRIKGTVAEVRTSGMQGRRADVLLEGGGPRRIMMVCDLDQYSGPGIGFRYLGKFEVVGTELLYLVQRKSTLTKSVVITQGVGITQFCSLKSMGASWIEFKMVNGPAWAHAETNQ